MSEAVAVDPNTQVSHEVDGRTLTGVGVSAESLAETMDRHTPDIEAPAETSAPASQQSEPAVKQTRGQRRFDELTREREEARREAADAKRERDELRARLSAPVERPPAEPPSRQAEAPQSAVSRAKPTEDEIGVKYQSYGDFVEDLADWKTEQRLAALDLDTRFRQSIEADRASRSHADLVQTVWSRGREAYQDFDAVINAPHMTANNWPPEKVTAIAKLQAPEQIQYVLGKDPALAERLRVADPVTFGMELAQLLAPQGVARQASTPAAVVPAPYSPVGSGSRTSVVTSSEIPHKFGSDFDRSGYREKRARERGLKR
jgi:hypothetical protein